jgi:hypothetical protein
MYEKRLGDANYSLFKLARTNNRGDGEPSSFISLIKEYRNGQNILLCCVVTAAVEIAVYYEAET